MFTDVAMQSSQKCMGCNNTFKLIFNHLKLSPSCKLIHDRITSSGKCENAGLLRVSTNHISFCEREDLNELTRKKPKRPYNMCSSSDKTFNENQSNK